MNIKSMKEEKGEEVFDPFYITQVEAFPFLELDWDFPKEDDL